MNLTQIVAEWRRGCSNTEQHYKDGVPSSSDPGACAECTAAAMRAVARLVDQENKVERWPDWDLFLKLIKEGPPRRAVRCLLLNAVASFRIDYPEATVENAIGWGSLRSRRNVGKAVMNFALDIVKAWRARAG